MKYSIKPMIKQSAISMLNTEDKILKVAYNVFLLFGYHGTTLNQIASSAGVNKAAIHYYFRSKEKLYRKVVKLIIDLVLNSEVNFSDNKDRVENTAWFLFTELYNNRILFEHTMKELFPNDWERKVKELLNWIEFSNNPFPFISIGSERK